MQANNTSESLDFKKYLFPQIIKYLSDETSHGGISGEKYAIGNSGNSCCKSYIERLCKKLQELTDEKILEMFLKSLEMKSCECIEIF